jgi:glycerol-3-phosphate dehydrogenase
MPESSSNKRSPPPQHGVKGVYYGGDWLDIEDCADTFLIDENKCSGCRNNNKNNSAGAAGSSTQQVRSASSNYDPSKVEYDVVIIGAGCIGAAVARELSKTTLSVLWLESADDVRYLLTIPFYKEEKLLLSIVLISYVI